MFLKDYELSIEDIDNIVCRALDEDTSQGDVTSEILIPKKLGGRAIIKAKEGGILAGAEICERVFIKASSFLEVRLLAEDGSKVWPGDIIAIVSGGLRDILRAERVALNFLQRLSGIATATSQYVTEVKGLGVRIYDTRKTTPGIRIIEKYAVACGGGNNHRFNLADGILIKDNHLVALHALGMGIADVVAMAKRKSPVRLLVEVEVSSSEEAVEAAKGGADIIMLDNMDADEMHRAVCLIPDRIRTEASGGITLANIRSISATGINDISIGALTHSVKALDISLEIEPGSIEPE
jgi:nicotinate-nucleotide pyrophosphorylase (carboxylating)